jgi:hypothetical protein
MMTTKDALFSAAKRVKRTSVNVSAFMPDVTVCVKVLTGTELDKYTESVRQAQETKQYVRSQATLVALAICDGDGNPLATLDDVPHICDWNGKLLEKLFSEAFALNRIGADEIEAAEKN